MLKGITPVIAIIILLLVAISIAGVFFVYLSGIMDMTGSGSTESSAQLTDQLAVQFRIENIYQENVSIRNTGGVEMTDITFYVDGMPVNYTGTLPVPVNGMTKFSLNLSEIYEPTALKVISGIYKQEADMKVFMSDKDVCQAAEENELCDGLDIVYGEGYKDRCCSEHGLCC